MKPPYRTTITHCDQAGNIKSSNEIYLHGVDPDDEDFDVAEFYCELPGLLSDEELQAVLPIKVVSIQSAITPDGAHNLNWAMHTSIYIGAWVWFDDLAIECGCDFAGELFTTFSDWEKAVLQRGFRIMYCDDCPELSGNSYYAVCLAEKTEVENQYDFPLKRTGSTTLGVPTHQSSDPELDLGGPTIH